MLELRRDLTVPDELRSPEVLLFPERRAAQRGLPAGSCFSYTDCIEREP